MNCPNCGKELHEVKVYSQCVQDAEIDKDGNVTDYSSVEDILETLAINCPYCLEDIADLITEK